MRYYYLFYLRAMSGDGRETPVLCSMQLLRCGGNKPAEEKGKTVQKSREEAYWYHTPADFLA